MINKRSRTTTQEDIIIIKLRKGMTKDEVDNLIGEWISFEDDTYLGNNHKHKWRCKCGNIIENKTWSNIRERRSIKCSRCKYNEIEERYKYEVEKDNEYEYIRSFRSGDTLPNGRVIKYPYVQVKHKYCGSVYEVIIGNFINQHQRCGKCCQKYENSFAYYIEQELGEPLDKYWDLEKNTVNPYHVSKGSDSKVWIKCTETDYHGSYEIRCADFIKGKRCSYCNPTGKKPKIHPLDSFGYKHFDKAQSWHPDNDTSPFRVSPSCKKKCKFICPECGYIWSAEISNINNGSWCPQCASSKGEKRINSWLRLNNIEFVNNKPYFNDLLSDNNKPLRPDFILPDHKIWIEYDGEFHYRKYYEDQNYEVLKIHDKRKDEYAKEHGWKLIRIPYWDFDNIEEILKKELNV